ncbi:transposable element Tc1 transposase [Trichonephila clavipes]|nr:transposable element Tc1 transposase [Trichonephila clavipes]
MGEQRQRHPGQHADPAFTNARHTEPQPGVIVWGTISFDCWTSLVDIKGTPTAQRHNDDILRTVLLSFFLKYPGIIFQQGNARPQTERVSMNCIIAG